MKTEKQITGRRGEEEACAYLRERGQEIIARNWRSGHLELDIVTAVPGELHFVEVKSRVAPVAVDPVENVTFEKRDKVVRAAGAFLYSEERKAFPSDEEIFFDVITVVFEKDGRAEIEYYPNAFIPIYV